MALHIYNKKLVSKETIENIHSITNFVLHKFFTPSKAARLHIDLKLRKSLFEEQGQYANCIWEDTHYRPNDFTIELDPDQKPGLLLNSVAHELVHVKQWAKGEMFELQRQRKVYKFNGQKYNLDKMDYWDHPWEIEAHGRAIGLVVQWVRASKKDPEQFAVD